MYLCSGMHAPEWLGSGGCVRATSWACVTRMVAGRTGVGKGSRRVWRVPEVSGGYFLGDTMIIKIPGWVLLLCAALPTVGFGQAALPRLEIGTSVGVDVHEAEFDNWRIGGHLVIRAIGALEIYPRFNFFFTQSTGSGGSGSVTTGWQSVLNVRVHPFGVTGLASVWYVGTGVTVLHRTTRWSSPSRSQTQEVNEVFHVTLTGFEWPVGRFRPFVDLQLLDLFTSGQAGAVISTGVSVSVR